MYGTNLFTINHETMLEVLQEYFDKRFTDGIDPGPKVTAVVKDHQAGMFIVTMQSKEKGK